MSHKLTRKTNINKKNTNKKERDKLTSGFGSRKAKREGELFGVIGLGRFGMSLAENLAAEGKDLIVVDRDRDKINYAAQFAESAFVCDNLSRDNLEKLGFGGCDTVIVGIGRALDTSVLTVLNLINMGVSHVIAKAKSPDQGMVLEKMGAEVVYPEKEMGARLAGKLARPNLLEYITLGQDVDIAELEIGQKHDGMKVIQFDLRRRFSLNMIAIKKNGTTTADIGPETVICAGDVVAVIGKEDNIEKFEQWLGV